MTEALPTPPTDLTNLAQWVSWRSEVRGGKTTKVPFQPGSNSRAKTTDPSTWGTYADALASTKVDGIGFVFTAGDPFCGVDLDDCLDDEKLHPAAQDIVHKLDSYTEVSPSGTGLHVIVRATLPKGARHKTDKTAWGGAFEVYDRGRYFCVTGRAFR